MADEAPSLFSFLKGQIRRRPATGDDGTPGKGSGIRLAPGLWAAIVLSIVVVIVVLTSDNGGTPTTNTAKSSSPSDSSPPAAEPDSPQPGAVPPADGTTPDNAASPAPGTSHAPTGKTAYTRHRTALIVRSEPNTTSEVVARLGYDNAVTLMCHTTGPSTYGFQGKPSTVWDKITTPGGNVGYVPDAWVLTEAEVSQLVSPC